MIFLACLRNSPLYTKFVPEKNLLVLIKKILHSLLISKFFMLVRGQVFLTLYLCLYNFYLSRTIGQSLMSSPGIIISIYPLICFDILDFRITMAVSGLIVIALMTVLAMTYATPGVRVARLSSNKIPPIPEIKEKLSQIAGRRSRG